MIKRIFVIIYSTNVLWAVSAYPDIITIQQPDGTPIESYIKGDEWASWHETLDGWSITKNDVGVWVYAEGISGRFLIPGNSVVGQQKPPVFIDKHLKPIAEKRLVHQSNINLNYARTDTFKIPVIFFQFPDLNATYPLSDIYNVFNQEGYGYPDKPNSGSFREFYEEISYNQFSPVSSVVGVFTAPHNHDYYGHDGANYGTRVRQLVRAMVDSAEAAGFDWSQFDNDGDGDVDGVTLVHSGLGAEQGDGSNIWSHRSSMGNNSVYYDGVLINDYSINPEIQGSNIVAIGVLAHEFGHILGLPDLYDTDYSSAGAGKLALMASGSWGTSGHSPWYPSAMNAWCKTELGWSNVVELTTEQAGLTLEQSYSNNLIYMVDNPYDDSEYWLIENRQKKGTDNLMPSPGMLFWHIDTEKTSGWSVNNDEPHYGVGLEQADGLFHLENNNASDGGDPYPGFTNNYAFTHCTTPSTVSYYFDPSMVAFTNISDSDSIMSFDLSFSDVELGSMNAIGVGDAYAIGYISISMTNNTPIDELTFQLDQSPNILVIEAVETTGRASADSIIFDGEYIELVNPSIPQGNGEILTLTIFANTGTGLTVNLDLKEINSSDIYGTQVCFTINSSTYLTNSIYQNVYIDTIIADAGSFALIPVNFSNTIPIRLMVVKLEDSPDYLFPAEEYYTDQNNNGDYDLGEPYEDTNGDGEWTPIVQTTERTSGMNLTYHLTNDAIILTGIYTSDSIAVDDGPVFKVNVFVDSTAPAGNVDLSISTANLIDIFGYLLENEITDGVFIVTELSTENGEIIPTKFSMSANYPNPFNPVTNVDFTVPEVADVSFAIYSLLGQEILSVSAPYEPGSYKFTWNGRDQLGNELSSGVYLLKMETENFLKTRKLVLMK